MNKRFLSIGATSGLLVVILGAFSAHILKTKLTEAQYGAFETGVEYHFYHTLALLLVVLLSPHLHIKHANRSAWFFVIGICCFSGSLYLLACKNLLGLEAWGSILGPITPIGGVFFILGWLFLFLANLKK